LNDLSNFPFRSFLLFDDLFFTQLAIACDPFKGGGAVADSASYVHTEMRYPLPTNTVFARGLVVEPFPAQFTIK
jgi:hypothetical protein